MEVLGRFEPLMRGLIIRRERLEVIRRLFERIDQASIQSDANESAQNGRRALQSLLKRIDAEWEWRLFDLNYDDLLDEMLPNSWDAFSVECDGAQGFNAAEVTESALAPNALIHLHGSVRYGYAKSEHGESPDLLKFVDRRAALNSISEAIASNDAFHGDRTFAGTLYANAPMISGFQKADKLALAPSPFGYYFHAYIKEMLNASRVLVLGYSGSDPHMNTWLYEAARQHVSDFKLVYVTKNEWLSPIIESPEANFLEGFEPNRALWKTRDQFLLVGRSVIAFSGGLPLDQQTESALLGFLRA